MTDLRNVDPMVLFLGGLLLLAGVVALYEVFLEAITVFGRWRRNRIVQRFDPPVEVQTTEGPWLCTGRRGDGTLAGWPKGWQQ